MNTTFGYPFIRAIIKFNSAPSPGSSFNVTAKGVVKEGGNETSDTGAALDSTTVAPNAEVNNEETVPPDDNHQSTMPALDSEVLAAANDSAATVADVDEVSQSAASESSVTNTANQSDSATLDETTTAPDASGLAGETPLSTGVDVDSQSAAPESENTSTAAANQLENTTPAATKEDAAPDAQALTGEDNGRLAGSELDGTEPVQANQSVNDEQATENEWSATEVALDTTTSVAPNESGAATELNGDEAIEQALGQPAAANNSDIAAESNGSLQGAALPDSAAAVASENSESTVEAQSAASAGNSSSVAETSVSDQATTAEPQADAVTSTLPEEEVQVQVSDATTASESTNQAAVSESSTSIQALTKPEPPNFALAAVKGFANAAQEAFNKMLNLPQTAAADSGIIQPDTNDAQLAVTDNIEVLTTTRSDNGGPKDGSDMNLSLN